MGFKDSKRKGTIVISDDDAEEEEFVGTRKRKSEAGVSRRKNKKPSFVDDAARCSDEEDEADDDFDDSDEEALFNDEQINVKALKRISRRGKSAAAPFVDDEEESEDEAEERVVGYGERSNLWRVKCKLGEEQEAVMMLLERDRRSGKPLTKCVMVPPNGTGFILVEASSEEKMKKACQGCSLLRITSPVLLSEKAVIDILMNQGTAGLKPGDKVRIKTGVYRDDVGEVVDVKEQAKVKLLPRLKLDELHVKHNRKMYPRKAIYLEEARKLNLPVKMKTDNVGRSIYVINNKEFCDGHLLKTFPLKNLEPVSKDVASESLSTRFAAGDKVKINDGKFKDSIGQVDDVVDGSVRVRLGLQKISFRCSMVTKHFDAGTLVRIKSGPHQDTTGIVMSVDGGFVIVNSDLHKDDIRVPKDSVQEERVDSVPAVTKLGDYQLHDLVALTSSTCGMILKMEKEAFRILTTEQKLVTVKPKEVLRKIVDRFAVAQDQAGNPVRLKGMVRVQSGPRKGKQARVDHIYGRLLFVYDRQVLDNSGYFCAPASDCLLIGGEKTLVPNQFKSPVRTGTPRKRDPLLGKIVKVRRGPFKGYMGRVKRTLNNHYYVFLDAMKKEVKVQQDQLVSLEAPPPKDEENGSVGDEWGDNKAETEDGWGGNNNGEDGGGGGGWGDNEKAEGEGGEKNSEGGGGWEDEENGGDGKNKDEDEKMVDEKVDEW